MSTELKQNENQPLNHEQPAQANRSTENDSNKLAIEDKSNNSDSPFASVKTDTNEEVDKVKTFAFDINQKIDELQTHIDDLSGGFRRSKGALGQALGDLQSRTSSLTGEIDSIGMLIAKTDANKSKLMEDMEGRFGRSFNLLTEELGGIESQIQSQYARLNKLQRELNQSYRMLSERITEEKETTQNLVEELEKENEEQNKTQRAFSDYLGELQEKSNTTADDVYKLVTDLRTHKRLTNKHFKVAAASMLGITVLLSSAMVYMQSSDTASEALLTQQIEHQLEKHASEITEIYASKAVTTDEINQLGSHLSTTNQSLSSLESSLTQVQTTLASQKNTLSNAEANTKLSLEQLFNKLAAIEFSLYGPANTGTLPSPEINIQNNDWIAQQNTNHYVIQLIGVYRERSVISFANRHALALQESTLSTNISKHRGQDWYNLYYGNYSSFSEAQTALDRLPASIQSNSPWIRRISSVQKSAKTSS